MMCGIAACHRAQSPATVDGDTAAAREKAAKSTDKAKESARLPRGIRVNAVAPAPVTVGAPHPVRAIDHTATRPPSTWSMAPFT
jgi:hypothetical protein